MTLIKRAPGKARRMWKQCNVESNSWFGSAEPMLKDYKFVCIETELVTRLGTNHIFRKLVYFVIPPLREAMTRTRTRVFHNLYSRPF